MTPHGDVHGTGPWAAVALGVSAHAAAAGCLPALLPTLLVLPPTLLAVRLTDGYLRRRSVLLRAVAGQLVVHVALTLATTCGEHPGSAASGHMLPVWDMVMTAAHVVALVLAVAAAARLERDIVGLLQSAAGWLRKLTDDRHSTAKTERPAPAARPRPGFVPTQVAHRRCGVTRGPPTRSRCRVLT